MDKKEIREIIVNNYFPDEESLETDDIVKEIYKQHKKELSQSKLETLEEVEKMTEKSRVNYGFDLISFQDDLEQLKVKIKGEK